MNAQDPDDLRAAFVQYLVMTANVPLSPQARCQWGLSGDQVDRPAAFALIEHMCNDAYPQVFHSQIGPPFHFISGILVDQRGLRRDVVRIILLGRCC